VEAALDAEHRYKAFLVNTDMQAGLGDEGLQRSSSRAKARVG
jgi:hypothetical protein